MSELGRDDNCIRRDWERQQYKDFDAEIVNILRRLQDMIAMRETELQDRERDIERIRAVLRERVMQIINPTRTGKDQR